MTITAAARASVAAKVAVGAIPESKAVCADSSSFCAVGAGNSRATAVAPPMLSAASPA